MLALSHVIRVDEQVAGALREREGKTWNDRVRDAIGLPPKGRLIAVLIEPTGSREYAATPEEAVDVARLLLDQARALGHRVPRASFYANGKLVRASVTRTDLAVGLGACWCGRGALYGYPRPGEAFCCAEHRVLWDEWTDELRARVIVARFLAIYGRGTR